ncbi:NXPE family member 3-like, partial [Physella acuta]|uniref:NXPE family member 3-like n=1 Tax=Physella acuta TaxID=109671 RepID=UPI0027DB7D63
MLPSSTDKLPSSTDKLPSSKVENPSDQWPSLRGTAITLEEIEEKFQRCKSVSIERDPRCRDAHENSHGYWRPEGGGRVEVIRRMNLASTCCAFNHKELMMPAPHPQLYPWEKDFLSHPPLRDIRDIASADNSKVVLVNDSSTFRLGDIINIQVVLFNGRGERITIGGTSVRVWLVTDSLKAAIAADVTDNLDGTYLASCPLPWSGSVKVKATIAHHRELFRTNFYLQRLFTTTHWLLATFNDGTRSEVTPCSAVPKLPGYNVTDICNLTEVNQFPWYCGKPRDLKCTDWTSVRKIDIPSYYPMTQAEEELIFLTESKRPFMIPSTLTFEVSARTNATATPSPLDPCNKRNLSTTFDDVNSSGYFYNGSWRSLRCQLPVVDREFLIKCLNGTQMLILGDSNSRLQMDFFREMTKCQDKIPRTKVVWHAPLQCDIDNLGVSIKYFPPKHPFYGSMGEDIPNSVLYSTIQIMDGIPASGKYLVHLHQFLHLMPFHLSVAEHHLRL